MRRWSNAVAIPAAAVVACLLLSAAPTQGGEPIPDKVLVLTFDDSVKSHFTVVRPILKKYKFGATFFVTEGFDFKTDKKNYMTWEEIAQLHKDGFEIGNHTRDHLVVKKDTLGEIPEQLEAINKQCKQHGIPKPITFAYPGNGIHVDALPLLQRAGIKFARRGTMPEFPYEKGQGVAYEPGLDHPLLVPTAGDARPDWTLEDFQQAVKRAEYGRIAVLQFHGVPDKAHPWVHTPPERFEEYMKYLADEDYKVIALRDVEKYVSPELAPRDAFGAINDRKTLLADEKSLNNFRKPQGGEDLKSWLENMVWYHRFTVAEIRTATGLTAGEVTAALKRFDICAETKPKRTSDKLLVLPYPGGRHPRIGFLEGAIRPQRETKLSVFLPWNEKSYVVVDVPEAIRWHRERELGLLYLAHTHVSTMWEKQGIELEKLEWKRDGGSLVMERKLPSGVVFGTKVTPGKQSLRMEQWMVNGSDEMLRGLRVQNCVMLKDAAEFAAQTNENKVFSGSYAACRSAAGNRWLIVAWDPVLTAWGNPPCPCMHSDPKFPDCAPGETKRLRGWLSFYEGTDVEAEFQRIEAIGWRK